jgi:hypothetical protein
MADQTTIPTLLERAQVPAHFPLFRNAAALAHLAHIGRGPPYVVVGGKAWYELTDINAWIESNKRRGPLENQASSVVGTQPAPMYRKRGRPTKMEQFHRQLRKPSTIST